jgi:hypothetical protein
LGQIQLSILAAGYRVLSPDGMGTFAAQSYNDEYPFQAITFVFVR